jgi:RHS repeat-associated protein
MKLANATTYTGRSLDTETGLYYYRNRYYHAQLGRFVSRDPAGYRAATNNFYEYAGSSPAIRIDPNGLDYSFCRYDMLDWRHYLFPNSDSFGYYPVCVYKCRCAKWDPGDFNEEIFAMHEFVLQVEEPPQSAVNAIHAACNEALPLVRMLGDCRGNRRTKDVKDQIDQFLEDLKKWEDLNRTLAPLRVGTGLMLLGSIEAGAIVVTLPAVLPAGGSMAGAAGGGTTVLPFPTAVTTGTGAAAATVVIGAATQVGEQCRE